jgi:hypothetical protein
MLHYLRIFTLSVISAIALVGCAQIKTAPRPDSSTWYAIFGEGTKPNRTLYFAKEGFIQESVIAQSFGDIKVIESPNRSIELMIVNESEKQADSIYKKIRLDCNTKQKYVEEMNFIAYRNGTHDSTKQTSPQAISAPWQHQLARFACGPMADLSVANGFLSLGSIDQFKLVDLAWGTSWKDGTRPPYTTTKTLAQMRQDVQRYKEQLDGMRKTIDEVYLKGAASPEDRLRADLDQTHKDAARAMEDTRRRSNVFNPVMETWIGATEEQLVSVWGRAQNSGVDANGDRTLTYTYGYTDQGINGYGAVVSEYPHYCDITWSLRNGIAITYHWKYTSARSDCSSLTIGMGPYPQKQFK